MTYGCWLRRILLYAMRCGRLLRSNSDPFRSFGSFKLTQMGKWQTKVCLFLFKSQLSLTSSMSCYYSDQTMRIDELQSRSTNRQLSSTLTHSRHFWCEFLPGVVIKYPCNSCPRFPGVWEVKEPSCKLSLVNSHLARPGCFVQTRKIVSSLRAGWYLEIRLMFKTFGLRLTPSRNMAFT